MHVQHHTQPGQALGRSMELREFGDRGQPLLAFPSQEGHARDFEGFGMVHACAPLIEAGRVRLFVVDGNDWESWTNRRVSPAEAAHRHLAYDRYVMDEVVPFAQERSGRPTLWTTGCSMGAFHAANFCFRRPDVFDGVIAISGLYDARHFLGDGAGDDLYFNNPVQFLAGLEDPVVLARLRAASITFMVGQGAWEEECLQDTRTLDGILAAKGIPAWFDYWGHDVNHDWPWWRKMLPYALEKRGL
jgi:esterase/lipase superfamily enzyme